MLESEKYELSEFTKTEIVDELEREIKMRRAVFFRKVQNGTMKRDVMERRISIIEAIIDIVLMDENAENHFMIFSSKHRKLLRIERMSDIIKNEIDDKSQCDLFETSFGNDFPESTKL